MPRTAPGRAHRGPRARRDRRQGTAAVGLERDVPRGGDPRPRDHARRVQAPARRATALGLPAGPPSARGGRLPAVRDARLRPGPADAHARRPVRPGLHPAVRRRRLRGALLHAPRPPRAAARALTRLCAFDLVANNADRKSGHCLLGRDGRLYAIDNGLCFHVEPKLRTVVWDFAGEPIPEDVRAAARRLAAQGLPGSLADLLAPRGAGRAPRAVPRARRRRAIPRGLDRHAVPMATRVTDIGPTHTH